MFNNTWGRRPGFGPGPGFRPNQYGNRSWRRGAVRAFVDTYAKGQYDPSTMARLVSEGPGGTLRFQ